MFTLISRKLKTDMEIATFHLISRGRHFKQVTIISYLSKTITDAVTEYRF